MERKNNATCSICGRSYYKCMACADMVRNRPWQLYTDNANCYKVFQIIRGYNTKIYTKEEAKAKLHTVDLSDFDNFRDNIKEVINYIISEDNNIIAESVIDSNDEVVITKPKTVRRKKIPDVVENVNSDNIEVKSYSDSEAESFDIVGAE